MAEMFDVYGPDGQKTGEVKTKADILKAGAYRLVAHLWIYDPETKLVLCQKRASGQGKKMWDGLWDVSVGGGVPSGEDTLTTVVRETDEELGLIIDPLKLVLAGRFDTSKLLPEQGVTAYEFSDTYVYPIKRFGTEDLTFQVEEVDTAEWVSMDFVGVDESRLWVPHPPSYFDGVKQFIMNKI